MIQDSGLKIQRRRGFTLIEILIVVAIIGILASVVLVGLGPIQRQGRDSRRISDLRQAQNGLELFFNRNGQYPAATGNWQDLRNALLTGGIGVSNVPNDPRNVSPFVYQYGTDAGRASYVLGAQLEDGNNPNLQDDVDGTVHSVNCGSGSPETPPVYCVQI